MFDDEEVSVSKPVKPGFMVYHGDLEFLSELSDAEFRAIIEGLDQFSQSGEVPSLAGASKMAFNFMAEKVKRDAVKYQKTCERNRKSAKMRWGNSGNDQPGATPPNNQDAPACDGMRSDAPACDGMRSDAVDANCNGSLIRNLNRKSIIIETSGAKHGGGDDDDSSSLGGGRGDPKALSKLKGVWAYKSGLDPDRSVQSLLLDALETLGEELAGFLIEITFLNGRKSHAGYFRNTLEDWRKHKIRTIEDAQSHMGSQYCEGDDDARCPYFGNE